MILPTVRDPRLITIRRGGTLTDADHHLLALWAADCAEHVLGFFEEGQQQDPRPRQAIAARQAACVGPVAEHDLGAAAYAIRAAQAAAPDDPDAAVREREWQRRQIPEPVRSFVLEDQVRRSAICWDVFTG